MPPKKGIQNKQKSSMKPPKIRKTKQVKAIKLSLPKIIMQELEKFLLTEFWVKMVKLLLKVIDTN